MGECLVAEKKENMKERRIRPEEKKRGCVKEIEKKRKS